MKLIRETTILSAPKGQNRPLATPADGLLDEAQTYREELQADHVVAS